MTRQIYRDFDEFAESIRGLAGHFIPTSRATSDWWIETKPLDRVTMQRIQIGGAGVLVGDGKPGAITLGVPLADPASIRIDGVGMESNSFFLVKESQPFTFSSTANTRWAGVTMPVELMGADLRESEGAARRAGKGSNVTQGLEQMRRLIARVCADDGSVAFRTNSATHAAEEEIVAAASGALEQGHRARNSHTGRPQVSRARIIARAFEVLDASDGRPLFIDDLLRATQVSERTLRNVFQEYFGVGPMRLLRVRQLHQIRAALLAADADQETITHIAARFGVWDFSQFARNYHGLYGERPSATLRRKQPESARRAPGARPTWIRYVSRSAGMEL